MIIPIMQLRCTMGTINFHIKIYILVADLSGFIVLVHMSTNTEKRNGNALHTLIHICMDVVTC